MAAQGDCIFDRGCHLFAQEGPTDVDSPTGILAEGIST